MPDTVGASLIDSHGRSSSAVEISGVTDVAIPQCVKLL
jgi:hypothetical protein